MRNVLYVILIALLMSSCGMFKNIRRDKPVVKSDSISTTQQKVETVKVIHEKVDTTISIKGSEIKSQVSISDIDNRPIVLMDDNQTVTITKVNGDLLVHSIVRDRTAHVLIDRKTEEKTKATSSSKTKTSSVKMDKRVDQRVQWMPIIIVLLIIAACVYIYYRLK